MSPHRPTAPEPRFDFCDGRTGAASSSRRLAPLRVGVREQPCSRTPVTSRATSCAEGSDAACRPAEPAVGPTVDRCPARLARTHLIGVTGNHPRPFLAGSARVGA
jgi:hypothetical protein